MRRQLKDPITDTHDISNYGGPRLAGSTDTDSAFLLLHSSRLSLGSPPLVCILTPFVTALVNAANLMSQMSAPVPRSIISATWLPPLSLQAPLSGYQDIEDLLNLGYFLGCSTLSSLAQKGVTHIRSLKRHATTVIDVAFVSASSIETRS